jgi:hypothetical protein
MELVAGWLAKQVEVIDDGLRFCWMVLDDVRWF